MTSTTDTPKQAAGTDSADTDSVSKSAPAKTNCRSSTSESCVGARKTSFMLDDEARQAILDLQREWGFQTHSEAVVVALKFLQRQTRNGLQRIALE